MASIPTTTMRIDPQLKEESSQVLEDLGLTLSGAVTIFLKAVVREQGAPVRGQEGNEGQAVDAEEGSTNRAPGAGHDNARTKSH
ncbi:MAG: type II toxin-antitoxin system RelB/DinJ family antitoxin [Bifidobacterium bifidum]